MKRIYIFIFTGLLTLVPFFTLLGQTKNKTTDTTSTDVKVLEERVERNEEKTKIQLDNQQKELDKQRDDLRREMEIRSDNTDTKIKSVDNQVDTIWQVGLLILAILSFVGYKVISEWIRKAVEDKAKAVIDASEKEIIEKGEESVKILIKDLEEKWEKRYRRIEDKWDKEYEEYFFKLKDKQSIIDKPLSEETKKDLDEFEDRLEKVKDESEYTAFDWYFIGLREFHNNRYEESIKAFTNAIDLDSEKQAFYADRGIAYAFIENYEKSLNDFNSAISIDSNYSYAYTNRGVIYARVGQFDNAILDYKEAIRIDPNDIYAYRNISESLIITGKYNEANRYIDKAVDMASSASDMAKALFYKCINMKLADQDTLKIEKQYDKILEEKFKITWSFKELEEWLETADISDDKKEFIRAKIELLKKKMK